MTAVDTSYSEQIGRLLDRLRDELRPFVERALQGRFGQQWPEQLFGAADARNDPPSLQDVAILLRTMALHWNDVFGARLSRMERALVGELIEWRNRWAHGESFTVNDVARVEDNVERLLAAVASAYSEGAQPPDPTNPVAQAPVAGATVPKEVWYKCLVCGGVNSQPDEPWCAYRLPMLQPYGVRCGFQTRRWQKIDAAQATTLRGTYDIQDQLRRREFSRLGGPYVLGCVAVLLGILALIWVIGPMFIAIQHALAGR